MNVNVVFDTALQPYAFVDSYSVNARGFDPVVDAGAQPGELVLVAAEVIIADAGTLPAVFLPDGWAGSTATLDTGYPGGPNEGDPIHYKARWYRRRIIDDSGSVFFFGDGALAYRLTALRFTGGGRGVRVIGQHVVAFGDFSPDLSQDRKASDFTGLGAYNYDYPWIVAALSSGRKNDGTFFDGDIAMSPSEEGLIGTRIAYKTFSALASDVTCSTPPLGADDADETALLSIEVNSGD